jgi:hypothetical protein
MNKGKPHVLSTASNAVIERAAQHPTFILHRPSVFANRGFFMVGVAQW